MNPEASQYRDIIIKALERIPLFSGLSRNTLESLVQIAGASYHRKGTVIIKENEIGDRAYIVVSGRVRIYKEKSQKETVLKVAGPSEIIGEMSLFDGLPRSASAMVEEDALLFYITKEQFLRFVKTNPEILIKLLEALSRRIREKDDKIILLESLVIDNLNKKLKQQELNDGITENMVGSFHTGQKNNFYNHAEVADLERDWYTKNKYTCPLCKKETWSVVVRPQYIQVENIDSDMCTYYRFANPNFYKIIVCAHCKFAFTEETPRIVSSKRVQEIKQELSSIPYPYNYSGIRNIDDAIETYKMAIACNTLCMSSNYLLGTLNMNLSCLCRQKGLLDDERTYIKQALHCLKRAYSREKSTHTGRDLHILYMIGELHCQLGLFTRAEKWFKEIITHPDGGLNPYIFDKAKTRLMEVKDKEG